MTNPKNRLRGKSYAEKQDESAYNSQVPEAPLQIPIPDPPPDGGFKAWTQVLAGHLVLINCWGYIGSFGLFQSYYTSTLAATPSAISWIGSVQMLLLYFVGTFSGRALDAGYFHVVLSAGCFLQVLGVFTTSVASEYSHLFLAHGICKGLGDGLVFCPTISLVATYFSKKRAMAMAIAASGGASGGIIFPLIAQQLLSLIGFGWTVRVMGFVILVNSVIALLTLRVRLAPRRTGPLIEWCAFTELPYAFFCIGVFCSMWSAYAAFFYISTFAKSVLQVDSSTSFNLILVMNAFGLPRRVLCGLMADKVLGPVNTIVPVVLCVATLYYFWAAVTSYGGLLAWSIFYGFFGSSIGSLFPACCASLTIDLNKMGVRVGMCLTVASFASLTGAPIAGALIQLHDGGYLYAQIFGGISSLVGLAFLLMARVAKSGWRWRERL